MKTALIMEDGAMREMFTGGVIDVFLENTITCHKGTACPRHGGRSRRP